MSGRYKKKDYSQNQYDKHIGVEATQSGEANAEIFYETDGVYEITINPQDKYQYKHNKYRAELFVEQAVRKLRGCLSVSCEYELYIELSEPRNSNEIKGTYPRFHLHGTIIIRDVFEFLQYGLTRLMAYSDYQINQHRPDKWSKYCKKQQGIMKSLKYKGLPSVITQMTTNPDVIDIKNKTVKQNYENSYFKQFDIDEVSSD